MNAVEVQGLKKSFGEKLVLDDISMVIHQGDIYGFLGPDGSGKTTTLRTLLGVLPRDEGKVAALEVDPIMFGAKLRRRVNALP